MALNGLTLLFGSLLGGNAGAAAVSIQTSPVVGSGVY
jgi:hypothetical protein